MLKNKKKTRLAPVLLYPALFSTGLRLDLRTLIFSIGHCKQPLTIHKEMESAMKPICDLRIYVL